MVVMVAWSGDRGWQDEAIMTPLVMVSGYIAL